MPVLSTRVTALQARRFDAVAAAAGGRSALLRRLVERALGGAGEGAEPVPAGRRDAARIMLRLGPVEAAHVAREAAAMSAPRARWVAALVARHAKGRPAFPRGAEFGLLAIQAEVRRIGVNVNQIARALNTAVLEGRVLDTELAAVEDLRRELRAHMAALGEAFAGNLAYWEVEL